MHASETELALYVGGDLGWFQRFRVARHLGACPECRARFEAFASSREVLRGVADELPAGLEWNRLAAEMRANIHLGLEAGEIVAQPVVVRPKELTGWRPAAVLAGAVLVVALAWFANKDNPITPTNMVKAQLVSEDPRVFLETSAAGVAFKNKGSMLSLKHPKDQDVTFSVTLDSVRARYVDNETGQVTINNVYAQ